MTEYEFQIIKRQINKYLDEIFILDNVPELRQNQTTPFNNVSPYWEDDLVWSIACFIYKESGHKIELALAQDILNERLNQYYAKKLEDHYVGEQFFLEEFSEFNNEESISKRIKTLKQAIKNIKERILLLEQNNEFYVAAKLKFKTLKSIEKELSKLENAINKANPREDI